MNSQPSPFYTPGSKQPQRLFPAVEFTRFPYLPYELRTIIWSFVAKHRRIITIFDEASNNKKVLSLLSEPNARSTGAPPDPTWDHPISTWKAICSVPALLSVCHESRIAAIKLYQPAFGFQLKRPILFAPTLDVLMFSNGLAVEMFFRRDWSKPEMTIDQELVQSYAVLTEDDESRSIEQWARDRQLSHAKIAFEGLKEVAFVSVGRKEISWDFVSTLVHPAGKFLDVLNSPDGVRKHAEAGLDVCSFAYTETPLIRGANISGASWPHIRYPSGSLSVSLFMSFHQLQ